MCTFLRARLVSFGENVQPSRRLARKLFTIASYALSPRQVRS
jgi:hypothetical protein